MLEDSSIPLGHDDDNLQHCFDRQYAWCKARKRERSKVGSHLIDQRSWTKSIWDDKEATERFFLPIMDAILVIGQRAEHVLEMSNFQRGEALPCKADGELMAERFFMSFNLCVVSTDWWTYLWTR